MIRVFIADDHAVLREGLRRILEATGDMVVIGEAGDGEQVLRRAATERWDVLLLDLGLPGASGASVLRELQEIRPRMPVLVLSAQPEDLYALRLLASGAAGYVHKGRPTATIVEAIRRVHAGGRHVSPELAALLLTTDFDPKRAPHESLTDRQREILVLVGDGKSPSAIAARLGLRASTVSTHLHQIKTRLGLRTIGELAQYAARAGLGSGAASP